MYTWIENQANTVKYTYVDKHVTLTQVRTCMLTFYNMRIVINLSEETNVCDVMVVERPIDRSIARRKPVNRLGQCLYFWFCSSLRWCSPRLSYAGRRAESLLARPPVNQTLSYIVSSTELSIIKRTCQINITHMQYTM